MGLALSPDREPEDLWNDCAKRKDAICESRLGNCAGHSPDCAGRLILSENRAAVFANDAAARQTVGAHAGEHHSQDSGAVDCDGGAEEDVDGRAAVIFERFLCEPQDRGACVRSNRCIAV